MQTRSKTYHIGRRVGNQGPRPSVSNQAEVEKYTSGRNSSQDDLSGHSERSETNLNSAVQTPESIHVKEKIKKVRWTRDEYKEVIYSFYLALEQPSQVSSTERTYLIWRSRNPEIRLDMNSNKLANVRRYILNNNRLTNAEIVIIKECVKNDIRPEEPIAEEACDVDQTNNANGKNGNVGDIVEHDDDIERENQVVAEHELVINAPEEELRDDEADNEETYSENEKIEIDMIKTEILQELASVERINLKEREHLPKFQLNKKNKKQIVLGNAALKKVIRMLTPDITQLNNLFYASAKTITSKCCVKKKGKKNIHKKPRWREKIDKEIECLRGELSILTELQRGVNVKGRSAKKLKRKYQLNEGNTLEVKETIKQKVQLKTQRVQRFEKRSKFYRQNNIFKSDAKRFYREVGKEPIKVEKIPEVEEIETFWKNIWSTEKGYNERAKWINNTESRNENVPEQEWVDITTDEVRYSLSKAHKWKSPGIDQVNNFWLHSLNEAHELIAEHLSKLLRDPDLSPQWLSEGTTYLLPKTEETQNPKNYRPITCLSTTYKLLTSILTERVYKHLQDNNLFPIEQKGCKRGSYGCKDQLLINRMVMENCKSRCRNLSVAWIDYRKAFDSVPHAWILKFLEMFKVSHVIVNFLHIIIIIIIIIFL